MEYIDAVTKFIRDKKDDWDKEDGMIITFKEVTTETRLKASSWTVFKDNSGEIKTYEESSIPYSDDLDLGGVGRDVLLAGAASFFLPAVADPLIVAGIFGARGGKVIGTLAFEKLGWQNTYIFIFNTLKECVFAIEFHYSKSKKYFISNMFQEIDDFIQEFEKE